jgi:hypothetical protein
MDPLQKHVKCNNIEKAYIMNQRHIYSQMRCVGTETCNQVKLYPHVNTTSYVDRKYNMVNIGHTSVLW